MPNSKFALPRISNWTPGTKGAHDKPAQMWAAFGEDTITCMARGTRFLAALWQAAWAKGNGDANIDPSGAIAPKAIMRLYNDPDVVPSVPLDHYPASAASDCRRSCGHRVHRGTGEVVPSSRA